jgi:dolichol-phosphate mannosyltransferase
VPIEFIERVRGDSKMSGQVATESLKRITAWGLRERREQMRRAVRRRGGRATLRKDPRGSAE